MTAIDLWLRLRALVFPRRTEQDLRDELAFHLEMQARKHASAGWSEPEARRRAHAQFGSTTVIADDCRDARGIRFLETLWQDFQYAVRSFRRAPTFAVAVIGTIALGLGLNTAVFTIFNGYVLRPLAVRDPSSLYAFTYTTRSGFAHRFTWPEYDHFEKDNAVFSDVIARRKQLITRVNGQTALGELVTSRYFPMLGVDAALGRTLDSRDAPAPGREPVIVLSHQAWQRWFEGDPQIVGRTILVGGFPCQIAGVLTESFTGLGELPSDFWAPLTMDRQLEPESADLFGPERPERLEIVGRLKPGLAPRSARSALTVWARALTAARDDHDKATGVILDSKATAITLPPRAFLAITPILTAFVLVLVIACANVANLMLARVMARQREIGIRLSVGANRSRIVRQLLTECLLLAVPAAVVAYGVAALTVALCLRTMYATLPVQAVDYIRVLPLPPDSRVFGFSAVAAVLAALMFGLMPALQATRANIVQASRGTFSNDVRPARARNALVVVQIAASALLLICASVLLRGSRRVGSIDVGLRTRDVIELDIRDNQRARVLTALESDPQVGAIAATIPEPPLNAHAPEAGLAAREAGTNVRGWCRYSSPEYFGMLDIPLIAGRNFTSREADAMTPVAVITETAARRLWPGQNPIGRVVRVTITRQAMVPSAPTRQDAPVEVVGVARDVVAGYADSEAERTGIYLPSNARQPRASLLVRVSGDPETARRAIDSALSSTAPGAVEQIMSMQTFADFRVYPFRVAYWVSAGVGLVALLLTISGIYGVLSYLVTQRTQEIGIRMALGAGVTAVTSLILRQSLGLAALGLSAGAVLALGASALSASQLAMMNTFDAAAYIGGLLVVLVACLGASYLPAVRAARIDPIVTLRQD